MHSASLIGLIPTLLLSVSLAAQPVLTATNADQPVGLYVSYYADPTHQLTLNEITSSVVDPFAVSSQPVLNFGLSEATYWLRLRIQNPHPTGDQWLIELAYPLLDSVIFYQSQTNGTWQQTVSGELVANSDRAVSYKHFLFPIEQADTAVHTYYLQIKTESAARFPIFLHRSVNFFSNVIVKEIVFGLFYGAMLVMVLYNLFLFFALRERSYLFYCAFIFLNTCAQATFNGHVQLLGIAPAFANTWLLLTMFGAALFGVVFSVTFLRTKQLSPILHRILRGGALVAGVSLGLSFVLPYHINAVVASVLFLIIPLAVWISGLVAWRKGNTSARYFVIAWTMYLVAVTLISLRTLGVVPGSMPLEAVMQLGSVLDAVLLSLALAERISIYRRGRAKAQAQALAVAREKEQLVKEQNRRLEERVAERTEEISAQNEELQVQQEVIAELNQQLTRQNEHLEEEVDQRTQALARSNQQLTSQNQRLEQFASVTSHNLRGPIANILGLGNIFDRQNLNELNQQCLDHLQKATTDLDMVVRDLNQILTYNDVRPADTDLVCLSALLSRITEKLSALIVQEEAQIISDFGPADQVYAVDTYVENILLNLVANAIYFRSYDTVPVIRIASERTSQHVVVSVSDNGLGIDVAKYREKLFGLYQRFHTHREGRGVGLYLVKTQMEALGGHVAVESKVGGGTTFSLYFEQHPSQQAVVADQPTV